MNRAERRHQEQENICCLLAQQLNDLAVARAELSGESTVTILQRFAEQRGMEAACPSSQPEVTFGLAMMQDELDTN